MVFKTLKQKSQLKNIQLRNDEQNKISRNLHDGVAQDLAALKFYLRQDDKEKSDFYASQALNEVRYLIGALHIDLSKAFDEIITQMLQAFESNYKIQTQTLIASTHINTLPQTVQIEIIRILQESLSNIARHANASKVTVKFTDVGQDFKMTISDNGVGFDLEKVEELKGWYDGYFFGKEEIYNPWSVINYISRGCLPQAYWVNTGKNEILDDVLKAASEDTTEKLYALLQGDRVVARIDQNVVYRSLTEDPANIYSLLLVAGYLKTTKKQLQGDGSWLCEVSIPNREIASVYKSEILSHLMQIGAMGQ